MANNNFTKHVKQGDSKHPCSKCFSYARTWVELLVDKRYKASRGLSTPNLHRKVDVQMVRLKQNRKYFIGLWNVKRKGISQV